MVFFRIGYGIVLSALTIVFVSVYLRILKIFITNKKYRSLECYQLMIQAGIAQCLTAPGFLTLGISRIFDFNPPMIFPKVAVSIVRTEAILSFNLALNRLKIMCGLQYSGRIHTFLAIFAWIFGLAQFILLLTPFYDLIIEENHLFIKYDFKHPLSFAVHTAAFAFVVVLLVITLCVYLSIATTIHRKQVALHHGHHKERTVFLYSITRFTCYALFVILYYIGKIYYERIWDCFIMLAYFTNSLVVSPVLYAVFFKTVQIELFGKKPPI